MESDLDLFLMGEQESFAGAKVSAKTPPKRIGNNPNVDTVSDASQVDKLTAWVDEDPTGSMQGNRSLTDAEINALGPTDATIDIVRPNIAMDEFLQGEAEKVAQEGYTSEKEAALAVAKAMPETTDRERVEREQAIRDAMRIGKDIQAPGLTGGDTRSKDFVFGMDQTLIGTLATALDVARYTGLDYVLEKSGIDFAGLDQATQAKIEQLKNSVTDKDIFSANTAGQLLMASAALPAQVSRKLTAALLDGAVTYAMMQGAGNDDATSALGAIVAGGLTSGTMVLLERYKGTAALDDVVTNLAAGKNTDAIYKNFAKYTGREVDSLSNHDKVVAILASSEQQGASTLLRIAARDSKLKKSIDSLMESPNDVVKSALASSNIARTVNDLREQTKFAKTAYNDLEKLAIAYPTANINIGPAKQALIDELSAIPELKRSAGINKVLTTLGKENLSMADIIDMRKYLNGINFKASRVDAKTRESISAVEYLDSIVDANLPAEFKPVFSAAREELALSYALQGKNAKKKFNNKFSELALEIGKGNETYASTIDKLVKASGGTNKFNQLHKGLGYEQAKEFELGLMREIQNSKGENLGALLDKIKDIGFVTPEARDMAKRIRMLDKAFSSADFYNEATRVAIAGGLDSASITNDFLSKVEYSVAGSIWNSIKPYVLPISDNAAQERMFRRIMASVEKGLKSDTRVVKLDVPHADMYKDFKPVIREAIQNSIRTQIDNLQGMSGASIPKGTSSNLLDAPADFTVRADGAAVRQTGDAAQDMLSKEPINTTIVEESRVPSTSRVPEEDIIDVETWTPTSTVITPDGTILSIDDLLRGESLPDNMRLPEKASKPIQNFFDMKLKLKTDPDLIKAREEVKKAKTPETKSKAKDRLAKQLEYIRLREQGVKPSEAHRLSMQSSSEVGGSLAGGAMNGITIDDNGNVQVDTQKFLEGMAMGYVGVKGGKQLGKQLSNSIPKDAIIKENVTLYHGTPAEFKANAARLNPGKSGKGFYTYTTDDKLQAARAGSPRERYKSKNIMKMVADKLVIKEYASNAQAIKDNKDGRLQKLGYNAMQIKDEIIILDTSILKDAAK
jgi:hypothetical protein